MELIKKLKWKIYKPLIGLFAAGIGLEVILLFTSSAQNDIINNMIMVVFFIIVLIIFLISGNGLVHGKIIEKELQEKRNILVNVNDAENILSEIKSNQSFFEDEMLVKCFEEFKEELFILDDKKVGVKADINNYLNNFVIDSEIGTHFMNQVSGAMTGLGILGTFLGLSVGLNAFSLRGDANEVTKNIEPLMNGIKVAFHTSIIGVCYSLGFNYIYRELLKKLHDSVGSFIEIFEKKVITSAENGQYPTQAKIQKEIITVLEGQYQIQKQESEEIHDLSQQISDKIATMMENILLPEMRNISSSIASFTKAAEKNQSEELSRIVDQFIAQMNDSLGNSFSSLGKAIEDTVEWQRRSLDNMQATMERVENMVIEIDDINRSIENAVDKVDSFTDKLAVLSDSFERNINMLTEHANETEKMLFEQKEIVRQIGTSQNTLAETMISFEQHAKQQNDILLGTVDIMKTSLKTESEELIDITQSSIQAIIGYTTENTVKMTQIYDELDKKIISILDELSEYKKDINVDISDSAKILSEAVSQLSKEMENRTRETFVTFDKELADITRHFSGTLNQMGDRLDEVPMVVNDVYADLNEKFEKAQIIVDEYIEYADKLRKDMANKWQMFKDYATKDE